LADFVLSILPSAPSRYEEIHRFPSISGQFRVFPPRFLAFTRHFGHSHHQEESKPVMHTWIPIPILALTASLLANAAIIESRFDASTEGWTAANVLAGSPAHVASGGNPGGYLFIDNTEGSVAYVSAPAAFLGNLSAFVGGTLSFDANQLTGNGQWIGQPGSPDMGTVWIQGAGLTAMRDLHPGTMPVNQWISMSATLTAANWGVSEADFAAIMANVTGIRVYLEATFGAETNGFDNFVIQGAADPGVPEPSAWLLTGGGLVLAALRRRRR
jgi:hypothetical protein